MYIGYIVINKQDLTMNKVKRPILVLVVLVAWLALCGADGDDQVAELQQYCDNVKDNTWPNYKEIDCDR